MLTVAADPLIANFPQKPGIFSCDAFQKRNPDCWWGIAILCLMFSYLCQQLIHPGIFMQQNIFQTHRSKPEKTVFWNMLISTLNHLSLYYCPLLFYTYCTVFTTCTSYRILNFAAWLKDRRYCDTSPAVKLLNC